ncbi:palmitoyltransferase ZDHHC22 isoform X2 [Brienomyrus brachyistius]|uniref:palmitoyltransferase ZDHHC22 isoform X2 n=1 Tax=Brienomyrus brachyistius TaxID=42636 RepID=UPI0020B18394|nr:palmitoyltransferase ZDHHC22 isoform X2 [Brienomyrus brachyistius]
MYIRMFKLRLLNAIAPAYFFTATIVTFVLHFYFFIPTIFKAPGVSLNGATLVHSAVILYLMLNALGNYMMTIRDSAESTNENVIPVCSPDCPDKVDAHYLLNGRHFLLGVAFLTVEYSISFENPLTFLTLLPLSTGCFFLGTIPGLQFFLVLMLYVWLGIGLTCAGFCLQQVLLVARGQTWCQLRRGQLVESQHSWRVNLSDIFGSRWVLGLFLPVQTVEAPMGDTSHKHD